MGLKLLSALGGVLIMALVTAALVWGTIFLTNGDPLWFSRSFTAQADRIVIYWDGETTTLFPGDPDYEAIMSAFADMVAHWAGYEGQVGLSEVSLAKYRNELRLLEMHYENPVQAHTRNLYSKASTFYVPLSGTHANWRRIFAGMKENTPGVGVLNANEECFNRLLTAVEQIVQPSR
ncbi:MAG: hypothetical protein JXA21_30320 [Anaerolineae bacterium]|nr:hypothetical protein [Anaerolineae bacterium]